MHRFAADHEPGALVVSGTGLKGTVILNPSEWYLNNPILEQRYFSSNNHLNYHKLWCVVGYDLWTLLKQNGINTNGHLSIHFQSNDGFSFTETWEELSDRCCYPDMTIKSEQCVLPVIALYSRVIWDGQDPRVPIQWEAQQMTEEAYDHQRPRLFMGQKRGNPHDDNQPFFVGNLMNIIVGEPVAGEWE